MTIGVCAGETLAERLAIRTYTTADGLGSSVVLHIRSDSHGFLWLATRNGLSRFDGTRFHTYAAEDGLSQPVINFVLETRQDGMWVATNGGGVCRFNTEPAASPRFTCVDVGGGDFLSNRVNVLHEDRRGRIWLGTDHRLFQLERQGDGWQARLVTLPGDASITLATSAIHEDSSGRMWIGVTEGLLCIEPDDRVTLYRLAARAAFSPRAIVDRDGVLWIGHRLGLIGFRPPPDPAADRLSFRTIDPGGPCIAGGPGGPLTPLAPGEACHVGFRGEMVRSLLRDRVDRVWIGTAGALAVLDGGTLRIRQAQDQLGADPPLALAQDREGHIWMATAIGAMKFDPDGLVSYGPADGLARTRVHQVLDHPDHGIVSVNADWTINRFDGTRFHTTLPPAAASGPPSFYSHGALLDRRGRWWLMADHGLLRLPRAATIDAAMRQPPEAVFRTGEGLAGALVVRAFEDSRGDLWLAGRSRTGPNLSRWVAATDRVESLSSLFASRDLLPMAFAETADGTIWIGFEGGQLARHRDGRVALFDARDGVPASITSLHLDRAGALWIGSASAGVRVVRDPTASTPRFDPITTAGGLSTNNVQCITEDLWGRLYFGTARGIDRLDPATGRIRHFSTSDGLSSDYVTTALRGRDGSLWFGTTDGLSRLIPAPDAAALPSPVWIGDIRAAGTPRALPALGTADVDGITLPAGQNHLQIEFFGIGFGLGGPLRYRYRLDSDRDWSAPTDRRVVHYAGLGPGRYRFLVEAITPDGGVSARPASVVFTVVPPVWQRGWFFALSASVLLAIAFAWHRARVARLIELERVRARIAGDLHDDLGGSLSRIAIQSEVARRDAIDPGGAPARHLVEIGDTARGVVESLADVVWSVDPGQDDLASVERRLRDYAADMLGGRGVRWTFRATGAGESVPLDPERRRDLWLLFKEGVTNLARHADARVASLHLHIAAGRLHATLQDDGRGFDASSRREGRGLANMRRRAERLGGTLTIVSAPGRGTTVVLDMPVRARRRMFMRLRARGVAADHSR